MGVDFTPVDLVLQIGSPKGIARLIQRAGRSGHRPLETSCVICVPTHALELMEVAAARRSVDMGIVEPRDGVTLPLDLLAQHLVTVALGDGLYPVKMYRELKRTHAFRFLTRQQFDWVLEFVSTGGSSLGAYPEFRKIILKNGCFRAATPKIAARHRMNIGTITSDASILVKFVNGRRLGSVEERFVSKLKRIENQNNLGQLVDKWRHRYKKIELMLATGNHDIRSGDPPDQFRFDHVAAEIKLGAFIFTHKPRIDGSFYGIAGHLHPAVTITGNAGLKERLPCFCFGARAALLPAFGNFTGNQVIRPTPEDRIYIVADDEVVDMQAEKTSNNKFWTVGVQKL